MRRFRFLTVSLFLTVGLFLSCTDGTGPPSFEAARRQLGWEGLHLGVGADGTTVDVEDNYIYESIMNPNAKVRQGYGKNMPTYKGDLSDDEVTAIIEYIKSLK